MDNNSPMGRRYNLLCVPPKNSIIINELPIKGKLEGDSSDVKIEIELLTNPKFGGIK